LPQSVAYGALSGGFEHTISRFDVFLLSKQGEAMDRRTFNKLAGLAALGALADAEMSAAQAASVTGEVVLEDSELMVAFDPGTGALTRMEHKATHWNIERRPALGV